MLLRNQLQPVSFCAIAALILMLVACGPTPPAGPTAESGPPVDATGEAPALGDPSATTPLSNVEGYPAPAVVVETPESYPAPGEGVPPVTPPTGAYPPAEETFQEPRFRLDQPVAATATTVTGQAPPGVPLAIMDVTYNGTLLGTGRSDDNGQFSIPVSGLVAGNRIGISVAELTAGQSLNQMAEMYFPHRGEGFMNLPNVGIFFDTTLVQP